MTQVYYTVDKIGEGKGDSWKGGVGYVTREMALKHIPPPSDDNLILVCGPPPMYKALSGEKKSPKDQGKLNSIILTVCNLKSWLHVHATEVDTESLKHHAEWLPLVKGGCPHSTGSRGCCLLISMILQFADKTIFICGL